MRIFILASVFYVTYLAAQDVEYVLVIHGGAGNFHSSEFTVEEYQAYTEILQRVLDMGDSLLRSGVSALDVVTICVSMLEDSPLFNAGVGSVLNSEGICELDASIMDGATLRAGAIAASKTIKNPIQAARQLLENGRHVMLVGEGADRFARDAGLPVVNNEYFRTPEMLEKFKSYKQKNQGTVGAVALDKNGNLAAATSTGGMMMKMPGRVGDSPIIGAATYADNNCCAVSCTGHGEYFIRAVAAYRLVSLCQLTGINIHDATLQVLQFIKQLGGTGGIIAVDKYGNIAMEFTTTSMFRAYAKKVGQQVEMIIAF